MASKTLPPTQVSVPTSTPPPTPTPFIYTIEKGDTFGGLALRYGLTISDIEAANPGIDPNILSIGTTITIPLTGPEVTPTVIPTPTPVSVEIATPVCYPTANGGIWCLVLVKNPLSEPVENLSAWFSFQSDDPEELASQGANAYPPLNLLPSDREMPLAHFFASPLPENYIPQAKLLTALPAVITTTRYVNTSLQINEINLNDIQANVDGWVSFDPDQPPAGLVSLAVIAYSENEQPAGIAKWELAGEPLPASGVPFQITVFSLGPKIAHVEAFAEAMPLSTPESTAPE